MVAVVWLLLAGLTWLVFGQARHFEFVGMDDNILVYDNPHITGGLNWSAMGWIWSHFDGNFYIPLTSMSHMMDWSLYGSSAGGHHVTNVLLHIASVILLFEALREMTGTTWRSAFVAALFAIHPLHVESVAWISERKDTLSGLFFMLTLWAYARYARQPGSAWRYCAMAACFALGLLCKPSLVTLPCVLLLLDYWPLGRLRREGTGKLIVEKLPLAALSIMAGVVAVLAEGAAVQSVERFPIGARIANALVSYCDYIGQMFYPAGLAVYYPHPADTAAQWIGAALSLLALAGITAGAWTLRRGREYLLTGWCWYLGMLAPMIGLIQVGTFARADRFTYLSQIGLYIMMAWGAADLAAGWKHRREWLAAGAAIVIAGCAICASRQTAHWRDSESLWTHAVACRPGALAHYNLGFAYNQKKQYAKAIDQYRLSLGDDPGYLSSLNNLAWVLATCPEAPLRNGPGAVEVAEQAARITRGGVPEVLDTLAAAYAEAGRFDDAVRTARIALEQAKARNIAGIQEVEPGRLALYEAGVPYRADMQPSK